MRIALSAVFFCFVVGNPTFADDWQPAKGPLATRWAKDVKPDRTLPEYPRPLMQRQSWLNLNGLWQFAAAKDGEAPPTNKDLAQQILVPFPVESALSGVMKPADRVFYRRTFVVPQDWAGKRLLLHFGAVNWEATVWVNAKKLGEHRGGYDGFSFDITEALTKDGPQEIVVGVWNPIDAGSQPRGKQVRNPGGIFYTPSTGIWQTVWLEPVQAAHIESLEIVPDVDASKVRITVKGKDTTAEDQIILTSGNAALFANKGKEARRTIATAKGSVDRPLELIVPKEHLALWTPDKPYLFDLNVELRRGDKVVDMVTSYFGMRKIEIGKDDQGITRILLNGKFLFQVGPLDQGFWPDGLYTAPTDEALKYDIEITKQLGFNMARKHVKVEPERWYSWCDRLGLLVWQDMPSGDKGVDGGKPDMVRTEASAKQHELELKRMIDGRRNHPSIILWVVFNEGWGQYETARITEWTKKYDPSRLVDCASGWNDRKVGDVHDIHVYPGPGSPEPEPKRAAVLGEFGGLGLGLEGHKWSSKTWGYQGTRDGEDLTRKYEQLLKNCWKLKDKPGLSAVVYTQTTDVETEANGLLTYDRAVIKVDLKRTAAANRGDFSLMPLVIEIAATAQEKEVVWHYSLEKPADNWFKTEFDYSAWKQGPGGFGTKETPGAIVRTEWKTNDIWTRRVFDMPEGKFDDLSLLMHHDDDVEVYVNGVLAAKLKGFTSFYEEVPLSPEAKATLKPGKNTFAVHCHQNTGGQYIDVGIVATKKR